MNKMFKISSVAAALVVSGMLVGCGSSTNDSSTTPTPTPTTEANVTAEVTVLDGLVEGATVKVVGNTLVIATHPQTGANGKTTVIYQKSLANPTFVSTGGKTASGLPAPSMKSTKGGKVISPYTSLKADGKTDAEIATFAGISAEKALSATYNTEENPAFAKATVKLARAMYCEQKGLLANDNATSALTALEATTPTATVTAIKAAVDAVDDNNKTVDQVEEAVKATLGSDFGCKESETTEEETDPSKKETDGMLG